MYELRDNVYRLDTGDLDRTSPNNDLNFKSLITI